MKTTTTTMGHHEESGMSHKASSADGRMLTTVKRWASSLAHKMWGVQVAAPSYEEYWAAREADERIQRGIEPTR